MLIAQIDKIIFVDSEELPLVCKQKAQSYLGYFTDQQVKIPVRRMTILELLLVRAGAAYSMDEKSIVLSSFRKNTEFLTAQLIHEGMHWLGSNQTANNSDMLLAQALEIWYYKEKHFELYTHVGFREGLDYAFSQKDCIYTEQIAAVLSGKSNKELYRAGTFLAGVATGFSSEAGQPAAWRFFKLIYDGCSLRKAMMYSRLGL